MIDFEHVSKEYKKGGKLALEDINFHVDDGEFVFLLGHSGAGKSTLLKLILREEVPSEGKVLVDGRDVARMRRRQIPYNPFNIRLVVITESSDFDFLVALALGEKPSMLTQVRIFFFFRYSEIY